MNWSDYYENEKEHFLKDCTECGKCVKNCPISSIMFKDKIKPKQIASATHDFLQNVNSGETSRLRSFSCMECYQCVNKSCPNGINPMMINEIVRSVCFAYDLEKEKSFDPSHPESNQRIFSSILIDKPDYERISKASKPKKSKYVFFPGCNVYLQPEKILSALDIFDLLNEDYCYIPGLDYCCGDNDLYTANFEKASSTTNRLINIINSYSPEEVILWCPTCLCRFDQLLSFEKNLPFNFISFPQYLEKNLDKLPLNQTIDKKIVLHEAL